MFICLCTCRYTMSKMWRNFSLCVEPSLWPWWSLHDTTISIHQFHNSLLSGKCLLWSENCWIFWHYHYLYFVDIFTFLFWYIHQKSDCIFMKTFLKGAEIICCEDAQCLSTNLGVHLTYEFGFLFSENLFNVLFNRKWMVYN